MFLVPVWNGRIAWPVVLLLAFFSRTTQLNNTPVMMHLHTLARVLYIKTLIPKATLLKSLSLAKQNVFECTQVSNGERAAHMQFGHV